MSTFESPPPSGGLITLDTLQAAATEASLIIHNQPDFPVNSKVLGICAVPEEHADSSKYGWMVADFLAWKTILYGVGARSSQVSTIS